MKDHSEEIFGKESVYVNVKKMMRSKGDVASIPDGYMIELEDPDHPRMYVVEIEIIKHPLFDHITTQLQKFAVGIQKDSTRRTIRDIVYEGVREDRALSEKMRKRSQDEDLHRAIDQLAFSQLSLRVVIDEVSEQLKEALNSLGQSLGEVDVIEVNKYRSLDNPDDVCYVIRRRLDIGTQ